MHPQETYASLFKTGKIGRLSLDNRLIMAAMGNGLADGEGKVTRGLLEYYRIRAAGGVSMVVTQFVAVCAADAMPFSLCLHDDKYIPGMRDLVKIIHTSGAKACIQLMHPGMLFLLFDGISPNTIIKVPGPVPELPDKNVYHELTVTEIDGYVNDFAAAAAKSKQCGADAVEIHACHGCLLSTFLSPATNRRKDEYGGNSENRTRFLRRVIDAIRKEVGPDFPVIAKINGTDDIPGGISPETAVEQATTIASSPVDAFSISSGIEYWSTLMTPSYMTPDGCILPVAARIKQATKLPVIVAGKIPSPIAEATLSSGQADFLSVGRPLLANPEFPKTFYQERDIPTPECIYCNNCMKAGKRSWGSCTVNPFLYNEINAGLSVADKPRRIMVIGGGLTGMWTALFLKKRGHLTELYEKNGELGGQWNIAGLMPGKERYNSLTVYLKAMLDAEKVPVHLSTEVSISMIKQIKPDVAVVATGSNPATLDVPRNGVANIIQVNEVIMHRAEPAGDITVIGGSLLALEISSQLAEDGKKVTLVSRGPLGGRRGPENKIVFRALLRKMINLHIPMYLNTRILEIAGNNVIVNFENEPVALPADTVVLAIGVKAEDRLLNDLEGQGIEFYSAGDCVQPGNAAQAAFSALRMVQKL